MNLDTSMIRWHLAASLPPLLTTSGTLPLADWLSDGAATVIKDGPHRAVYRVRLPGLDCHVKHYRLLGLRSRVRQMLRPVKARREYDISAELSSRGVPTPVPLAWGVEAAGRGPAASWLITETVADAVPLVTFLETQRLQPGIRQKLAIAVGSFLAGLHASGVLHHDLHPGNLLVRFEDGRPLLWLIDLHAVRIGQPCRWAARRENLVIFNRYFQLRADRTDRLRFWRAYVNAAGHAIVDPSEVVGCELEHQTRESNLLFWRARDARCRRSNRYYRRFKIGAVRGCAVRDFDPGVLANAPDGPFDRQGAQVLKSSRSSTVIEFDLPVGGELRRVIYKRFRLTDRRDPWLALCRPTAAQRSWVFGHGLRERCLPTARPLAVFHRVRGSRPHEGYLLTEKIDAAVDLHVFLRRLATLPAADRTNELGSRSTALARLLRQLHDRGLSHRDLKAANVLTSSAFGDPRFWFIDLVGMARHRRVDRRRTNRDLMRLHVSLMSHPAITRTEKLRFLAVYLQANLRGAGDWKERWREIAAATALKIQKNNRSGRPLG
jgi:tRNA A-37 threonylcarbamoyl transferase component Bud32